MQDLLIHLFGPISIKSVQVAVCFTRKIISSFYTGRETYPKMVRKSSLEKGTKPSNWGPVSSTLATGCVFFMEALLRFCTSMMMILLSIHYCLWAKVKLSLKSQEKSEKSFWTIT